MKNFFVFVTLVFLASCIQAEIEFKQDEEITFKAMIMTNSRDSRTDGRGILDVVVREGDKKNIRVVYLHDKSLLSANCNNQEPGKRGVQNLVVEGCIVEVYGKVISSSEVSVCDSEKYYIKTLEYVGVKK